MTKDDAAAYLYDASVAATGAQHDPGWREDRIEQMVAGNCQIVRAFSLTASPPPEEPTGELLTAIQTLLGN